jgi:sporulation protein YlmC with PRC-barrel domain
MKSSKLFAIFFSSLITMNGAWAETKSDPVVGGAIIAVNVDVVATTGYRASKLLGSDIYNGKGENIGKLDDFIVGSDAKISIAVIAVGGVLGVGARMVAVPASLFVSNDKGQTVLPGITKDELNALPEFRYAK